MRVTISWRLRVRMAEAHIKSAADLSRRLKEAGYAITASQLSRIVDQRPAQIKLELLEALISVLGCSLEELMPVCSQK